VTNIIVFLVEYFYTNGFNGFLTEILFLKYGLVPYVFYVSLETFNPQGILTVLTSMFMHADIAHIAGNMLFLFVFGGRIESAFGHGKYLLFYLFCGIAGAFVHTFISMQYGYPYFLIPTVGASAAISGVLGAYLVTYPESNIIAIVGYFILPARAFWFIGLWFLIQLLYVFAGISNGIAYWAHIGGFVSGALIALLFRNIIREREEV
jgi:membrane associated rhomboid family serine protease